MAHYLERRRDKERGKMMKKSATIIKIKYHRKD